MRNRLMKWLLIMVLMCTVVMGNAPVSKAGDGGMPLCDLLALFGKGDGCKLGGDRKFVFWLEDVKSDTLDAISRKFGTGPLLVVAADMTTEPSGSNYTTIKVKSTKKQYDFYENHAYRGEFKDLTLTDIIGPDNPVPKQEVSLPNDQYEQIESVYACYRLVSVTADEFVKSTDPPMTFDRKTSTGITMYVFNGFDAVSKNGYCTLQQ